MIRRKLLAGVLAGLSCSFAGAQQLGSPFTIRSSPTIRYSVCDVAYDLTRDMYGLVFGRQDGTIRVQRFRRDGTLVGGEITLGTASRGRIVNLNRRNRFLVLAVGGSPNHTLSAWIVDPASGAISNPVAVVNQPDSFDVGGDATTTDDGAVVVWCKGTRVFGMQLTVTSSFQLLTSTTVNIAVTSTTTRSACISSSGGQTGRYLVAWTEANQTNIRGAVITRNMSVLDTGIRIDSSGSEPRFVTGIDGDGRDFVIAYEKREPGSTSSNDVFARSVAFDPAAPSATLVGVERAIEADPNDTELRPTVAFTGSSALISYIDQTGSGSDAYAKSVEPFACHLCESQFGLDSSNSDTGQLCSSIAERAAGADNESALVVWTREIRGGGTTIRGRFYTAEDGFSRDLGGGCGRGGETVAACARNGHSQFRIRVHDALVGNAFLVLGPRRIDMRCGPCELVPDPFAGAVVGATVGTSGRGSVLLPIPSGRALVGTKFYAQWLVPQAGAPCAALPGNFSNALEVEIQ